MERINGINKLLITDGQVVLLGEALTLWLRHWPDWKEHEDASEVRGLLNKLNLKEDNNDS